MRGRTSDKDKLHRALSNVLIGFSYINALFRLVDNCVGRLGNIETGFAAEEDSRLSVRELLDVDDPLDVDVEASRSSQSWPFDPPECEGGFSMTATDFRYN